MIVKTLLLFNSAINIFLLIYFWKRILQTPLKHLLFLYIIGILLWTFSIFCLHAFFPNNTEFKAGSLFFFVAKLAFLGPVLASTAQIWFIKTYPRKKLQVLSRWDIILIISFCLTVSTIFLIDNSLFISIATSSREYIETVRGPFTPFYTFFLYAQILISLILAYIKHKKEQNSILKTQFLWIFLIILFTNIAGILTNWILPVYFDYPFLNGIGPLFFLVVPFALISAIMRHRFLDLNVYISSKGQKFISFILSILIAYFFYYSLNFNIGVLLLSVLISVCLGISLLIQKKLKGKEKYFLFIAIWGVLLWGGGILVNKIFFIPTVTYYYGDWLYISEQILFFGASLLLVSLHYFFRFYKVKSKFYWFDFITLGLFILTCFFIFGVKDAVIGPTYMTSEGYPIIEKGTYSFFYTFFLLFFQSANIFILLNKWKTKKDIEEKRQFTYIIWSYLIASSLAMITNWMASTFFEFPYLTALGPLFFVFHLLIILYANVQRNFQKTSLILKKIGIVSFYVISISLLYYSLRFSFPHFEHATELLLITFALITLLLYPHFLKLFQTPFFHHLLGSDSIRYFEKTITDFMKKKAFYGSLQELQGALQEVFQKKLGLAFAKIELINGKNFPKLSAYFCQNKGFLVTQEIAFKQEHEGACQPFYNELQKHGEVCFPLYKSEQHHILTGFLFLGAKPHNDLYTKEELELLEKTTHYISLMLLGALYNVQLQYELQQKSQKLDLQNQEIAHILSQQSDFLKLTSHELRTPLTIALLGTQQILENAQTMKEDVKENAESIQKALGRLRNVIERLAEAEQYEHAEVPLQLTSVNIWDFLKKIHKQFYTSTRAKNVHFSLDIAVTKNVSITCDFSQIERLLEHLLVNALRYTPQRGMIQLLAREQGNDVVLAVQDNGEGVPDESKESIFQKFKSNHTMQSPGIGLGLYICRKIAQLHQGRIWVEDTDGGGATFYVKLPKKMAEVRDAKNMGKMQVGLKFGGS